MKSQNPEVRMGSSHVILVLQLAIFKHRRLLYSGTPLVCENKNWKSLYSKESLLPLVRSSSSWWGHLCEQGLYEPRTLKDWVTLCSEGAEWESRMNNTFLQSRRKVREECWRATLKICRVFVGRQEEHLFFILGWFYLVCLQIEVMLWSGDAEICLSASVVELVVNYCCLRTLFFWVGYVCVFIQGQSRGILYWICFP